MEEWGRELQMGLEGILSAMWKNVDFRDKRGPLQQVGSHVGRVTSPDLYFKKITLTSI